MKFGLSTFITDYSIRPTVLARAIEERGFESLFLPDHSHIPVRRETAFPIGGDIPAPYYHGWDPFIALSAAATVTTQLKLGTGIALLIQRDVIQVAKEVASLDSLSSGRFIFGVGVGWNREEMRNHGVDPRTRGCKLDEQIHACINIWSCEHAEYHGRFVKFNQIFQWPKPVQSPYPAIYIGGSSVAAVRRAVRLGLGWMPTAAKTYEEIQAQIDLVRQVKNLGLPITIIMVPRDPKFLDAYYDAGVDRVTLFLPVKGESDSMHRLDNLTAVAEACAHRYNQ